MAIPEGVAMIGLGISLWRTRRQAASVPAVQPATTETAPVR